MEADAVALPKQVAARQGLLIAFIDESGLSGLSCTRAANHRRVLPERQASASASSHHSTRARSSGALKAACVIRPPRTTTRAAIPAAA